VLSLNSYTYPPLLLPHSNIFEHPKKSFPASQLSSFKDIFTMKFATITLFLAGLAVAIPTAQSPSPISDAIAAQMENYLAEKIRSIDPAIIAQQAVADLQPAIAKALSDYAGKIKIAQLNLVAAAQRAALERRDPQGAPPKSAAGPMAAASVQLRKVSEDVGVSIGTMIGKFT
jgi:hypothetical protein